MLELRIHHVLISIAIISFLSFLYLKSTIVDVDLHGTYVNNLRHLMETDTQLKKDILDIRYGITRSHDAINDDLQEFKELEHSIVEIPPFVADADRVMLLKLIKEFDARHKERLRQIEEFKAKTTIYHNSLSYFPQAMMKIVAGSSSTRLRPSTIAALNDNLDDILLYSIRADHQSVAHIEGELNLVLSLLLSELPSDQQEDTQMIIAHGKMILKLKPEIESILDEIQSVKTNQIAEQIYNRYDKCYRESMASANVYRLALFLLTVSLLTYVIYIILKLKKATIALNHSNEMLEHRVEERTAELSKSNADLQKSELDIRALLRAIPDSMWRIDSDHKFVFCLLSQEDQSLFPTDDWIGNHIASVLPASIADRLLRAIQQATESGKTQFFEFKYSYNDKIYHYDCRTVVCGADETLTIVRNISNRKQLEEQLHRAQKLESIGQLAAGIAHEINTPTQYVGDNTRFLQDSFQDLYTVIEKNEEILAACRQNTITSEMIDEMEELINRADVDYLSAEIPKAIEQSLLGVERISKIVQSMKDFAHPGSSEKKAIDINRAIESTVTVARNEWKYVADLETDYDQQLPQIPCLVGEFNQVILNMIINASHAIADVVGDGSNGKGTIRISTRRIDHFVEIRIGDTGSGIPEQIRKKIFDPFFTTKEVGKGTGQGLAISHSVIVEKHNGSIDVESEIGKGTTFIIKLPLRAGGLED